MKLKKLCGLLMGTVMMASMVLTGCGGSGNAPADDEGDKTNETEEQGAAAGSGSEEQEETGSANKIVVFQSKVEIIDQLEALAEDYEAETGVEVEVWGTTGDDYFQQLKTKLANNQGPTIMSFAPGAESKQMENYLADLSDLSFVDKIAAGMADEIGGKVVGIPYTVEGFGMVYNKGLMDATALKSTDDFVNMLKEQQEAGVSGFGLSQESYFLIGHILNTPFALQEDPESFMQDVIDGKVNLKDVPEFQEFAKLYDAIRTYSYNPLEANYDKECGDFATGKTAAIHQGNWCYSMFADYDMDFDMGMAALPLAGNDKLAVSVPTAWYVNSQASPEEQQAGKDFLEWLYTSETGTNYLMNEFGFIPVVEGMTNDNMDPLSQEVAAYTEAGKTIGWATNYYPAGIVDVYLVPVAEGFFTTDMTTDEFLDELTNAFVLAGAEN